MGMDDDGFQVMSQQDVLQVLRLSDRSDLIQLDSTQQQQQGKWISTAFRFTGMVGMALLFRLVQVLRNKYGERSDKGAQTVDKEGDPIRTY